MSSTRKTFCRLAASVLATTVVFAALPLGHGVAHESDELNQDEPIGIESEPLATYTVSQWPAAFPVSAGAAATQVIVKFSNNTNVQFSVQVAPGGWTTITGFNYIGCTASTPNQIFTGSGQTKNFTQNSPVNYSIQMKVTWSLPTVTIQLSAFSIPGGTVSASSTTLCNDA